MRMRLMSWFVAAWLLVPAGAWAEDAFAEGRRLFDAGRYAAAVDKLQEASRENPENLDAGFYLGRAAFEAGDCETAVMAFERILIMEPDARRVKLELGRAYLKLGSHEIARAYFLSVLATNPPPPVWRQIQELIDLTDAAGRKHLFNGFVTVGLLHDDNVGAVPGVTDIHVDRPKRKIRLDQDTEADLGLHASALLSHLYRFAETPYAWKTTLSTYNNFHDAQTDYDLNYYALSTGIVRKDEATLWELQGLAGQFDLSGDRYLGLLGANLKHSRFLSRHVQLNLGLSLLDKTYYQSSDRNAFNWGVTVNPVLALDKNRVSLNLLREEENADAAYHDYRRSAVELRYDRQLPFDLAAYVSLRHQRTNYRQEEPLFSRERTDRYEVVTIGVAKMLWSSANRGQTLTGQISLSHTDNDSTLDLYTYEKDVVLTSLTLTF